MSNTTRKGLDAILSLLEQNNDIKPIRRRRFLGSVKDDVFVADTRNSVASGKRGNDAFFGKQGNDRFSGDNGNDVMMGGDGSDILSGGNNADTLMGGEANDQMDAGAGADFLDGGVGNDTLIGGGDNDQIVGGDGVDLLTGSEARDQFIYSGDVFANGTPALAGQTGIKVLGQPDVISDYTTGEDQFGLDRLDLGMEAMVFQKGAASQIADGNVIVLTDPFVAAGAAARAIANNANINADEGVFVYFNTTLGLSRVVYSKDLSDGGDISILANLDNQRGQTGLANLANFSATDFTFI